MKKSSHSSKSHVKKKHKTQKKGKVTKIIHESTKEIKIERALVENFITLQKVMVNMSAKFDNLSTQISKLLELFEISAKSLARKDFEDSVKENQDAKKIMEKLDNLSQQAGLIGRGLALIHESHSEKLDRSMVQQSSQHMTTEIPNRPAPTQIQRQTPPQERFSPGIMENKKTVDPERKSPPNVP